MKNLPRAKQASTLGGEKLSLAAPSAWVWADARAIATNLERALQAEVAKSDGTAYTKPEVCFRRVVYRAGRAGLAHCDLVRYFVDLNGNRKGRGRRSADLFATLLRAMPQSSGAGLSKAKVNKTAAKMRIAHEWDIHWRFYDLVVKAVGTRNMVGKSQAIPRRPSWADGLTSEVQIPIERSRKKASVKAEPE